MLLVQEHLVKLGGVKLSGQMISIDISQSAKIEDIKDDKGKTKANQPTGYESAKISIEFVLEDSASKTQLEQISEMQRLFKPYGQKTAKLLKIYNEDCAARGISKVYFQKLQSKNVISNSKRTVTLELLAPTITGIKLTAKTQASAVKKNTDNALDVKKKSKKTKEKSPAKAKRSTMKAKSRARKLKK